MSLLYKKPLHMVRSLYQYLIDYFGRKYLDIVNNVTHVRYENFKVLKAGQKQMILLKPTHAIYMKRLII